MTRTFLAIAAALLAATTFFTSAAKACISCEYTPPVVNTPVYSHSYGATHHTRRRVYRAVRRHIPRVREIVESEPEPKKVEAAKTAPVKKDVESENSTISTASAEKGETIEAKATQSDEPEVSKAVGCKKFFASVGMTLTVPCE